MKNTFIKKAGVFALGAALAVSAVGCAKPAEPTTPPTVDTPATEAPAPVVENVTPEALAAVLIDTYGEYYLAQQMIDAEMLEMLYAITPDMYDNYFAAQPMMMTHVDQVVMLHAEDTAPLMELLNAHKTMLENDTFQYPANLPRLATAEVVDFGNGWVGFFILGGQADIALQEEWGEDTEKAITYYTEQNKKGIDALKQYFADGIVPEIDVYSVMIPVMTDEDFIIEDEYVEDEIIEDENTEEDLADALADVIVEGAEGLEEALENLAEDVVVETTETSDNA